MFWRNHKGSNDPFHDRPTHSENPGEMVSTRVGYANDKGSWTESADVMDLFCGTLQDAGHHFQRYESAVEDPRTGLVFQPRFAYMQPTDEGGSRTTTTVEISHRELFPGGVFEYQHSVDSNLQGAILKCFMGWVEGDLPVLMDATRITPRDCTVLKKTFSLDEKGLERVRRILLGPVTAYAESQEEYQEGEHPLFCSCCMYTHSSDAFDELLQANGFYAIRVYAARKVKPVSDCRVNGLDHDAGAQALLDYAAGWTDRGVEFRKQLIVFQDDL